MKTNNTTISKDKVRVNNSVLLVGDSITIQRAKTTLSSYHCVCAQSARKAISKMKKQKPGIIVSDYILSDMNGSAFYSMLENEKLCSNLKMIFLASPMNHDAWHSLAEQRNVFACLKVPFEEDNLRGLVDDAISQLSIRWGKI